MTTATRTITLATLCTLFAGAAQAQNAGPFSLEVRAGVAVPTEAIGTHEVDPGMALEIAAHLQVMPHLDLYAAWAQNHFGFEQQVGTFEEVENCGYAVGARFFAPSFGPVTPWVRGGAIYSQLELYSDDDDVEDLDSDYTFGWEAGAGAAVALGGRWSLLPGVRYRSVAIEMAELGADDLDVNAVVFDVGVSFTFGGPSMAATGHR